MDTDRHDRFAPGGDGEFSAVVRAAIAEICRQQPHEATVDRVVTRALRIPEMCSPPSVQTARGKPSALDGPSETDPDSWQPQQSETVACPDPPPSGAVTRKKGRVLLLAVAAALLACVWLGISYVTTPRPGATAFAETVAQIERAKTVVWKQIRYAYVPRKDGKGTWVRSEEEHAYKAPGLYREVQWTLGDANPVQYVKITDEINKKQLILWTKDRRADLAEIATQGHDPCGPFTTASEEIRNGNLQWVRKRKTAQGEVNVFRSADDSAGRHWSIDLWIDPVSKQLVGEQIPGADIYDPDNDPDRNNPVGEHWPNGAPICYIRQNIDFDAKLNDSQFSLEPPPGYTVHSQSRNYVTEREMIDYIGVLAEVNGRVFPGRTYPHQLSLDWPGDPREVAIWNKPAEERTPVERKYTDTIERYKRANLNHMPMYHFITDHAVKDTFRYFGKGVKLGDQDAVVCWYKLKGAKTYRVVHGDLSVSDVAENDLPLPVQP